ncbi:Dihydrolipoyl dehydrogenase [Nitrospina gracilis 3/211]|uniref:Dihydrolipoyl dehydrogenase n=1 Tax=Nitrospina gracilis (strain 3/211) TaxID=1266370 RepID=M1Z1S0_NITG3|nr:MULTISPECIES: dihydrolipoyl dehydrogenase [Nitrospina]MCF8724494.1 dihydrolipoamide dehydrogenase [Nitrospina sp. Nb-3]CCQ91657.1 Dihydrolipoyl dehydrogenase [Nitrospina gracilis 3/211]
MADKRLLVIGAGPGGYAAAFYAADRGIDVTLVNDDKSMGGVCLQRGCIPSKTLLHIARLVNETKEAREWGLVFGDPKIDVDRLRQWKNEVIGKMSQGLAQLCKQRGVKYVPGRAVFESPKRVKVGEESIEFEHAILATGSRPIVPGDFAIDSPRLLDSTSALEVEDIPGRLLIVGGGYIGLEMGTVYAALGSKVTVVEMTDGLLPGVDRDLVRVLQAKLRKDFEAIHLGTRLEALQEVKEGLKVSFKGESESREEMFDKILISIGRQPNTENLGLEKTRIELDKRGFVKVDKSGRTMEQTIFAIGDVIGGAMLAHKASYEGKRVVETILGESQDLLDPVIPAVVFTDPEIAWCGLTEEQAKAEGREVEVCKFPWGASGRATTLGRNDGQTKLILEPKTGKILGIGLVGTNAGELISEGVLAIQLGATAEDLAHSIHPHPTLSETLMEAAEIFLGAPTHIFKKKR